MGWPGENLLTRLWDTIESSGTGLLRPWQLKRVGMAETEVAANRLVLIAAAEKQVEALRTSSRTELQLLPMSRVGVSHSAAAKIEPKFDLTFITQQAATSQTIEFLRREVNIEKAVSHAESMLQQDNAEPPTEAMNMDWFFRWREYSGGMSSDALQQLWGNVLAGELKAPGLFNYRTLDFLRSLTQEEAKLIEQLAASIIEGSKFIYGLVSPLSTNANTVISNLSRGELTLLEEIGVLSGVASMGFMDKSEPQHLTDGRYIHIFACNGRGILATTDDPNKHSGLGYYRLTKLGLNLLQLVHTMPNEVYLLSLGQLLARNGFKVQIGDVKTLGNGHRSFANGLDVSPLVPNASVSA